MERTPPERFLFIDGLRAAALLHVLVFHCVIALRDVALGDSVPDGVATSLHSYGGAAVAHPMLRGANVSLTCFFVMSGFVLYLPMGRSGGDFGSVARYFARRAARIVPAFYFMLAAMMLMWPFVFEATSPLMSQDGVLALLAHLSLLNHAFLGPTEWGFTYNNGFGLNGAIWSLSVEVVFYAVLPLVARPFFRRPWLSTALALVFSLGWQYVWVWSHATVDTADSWLPGHLYIQAPVHAFDFACGMLAAHTIYARRGEKSSHGPWFWHAVLAASFVAVLACIYFSGSNESPYRAPFHTASAAAFGVMIIAMYRSSREVRWLAENKVAEFLGVISYGIFLWHQLVIQLAWRALDLPSMHISQGTLVLIPTVVAVSVVIGWISHHVIEQPVMKFVRSELRRSKELKSAKSANTPADARVAPPSGTGAP